MTISIQDILRAGHTKRWNIVNTTREQTVAEHMFNVAMIARTVQEHLGFEDHQDLLLNWALIHDIPEVVCGDPPSPTKKRMKDMGFDIEGVYNTIDPTYKEVKETAKSVPVIYDIVKIADLIDAVYFLHENGVGRHAKQVVNNIDDQLKDKIDQFAYDNADRWPPAQTKEVIMEVYNKIMVGDIYE